METEIVIPSPLVEALLILAAEREISLEELIEQAIKKYMEGGR